MFHGNRGLGREIHKEMEKRGRTKGTGLPMEVRSSTNVDNTTLNNIKRVSGNFD